MHQDPKNQPNEGEPRDGGLDAARLPKPERLLADRPVLLSTPDSLRIGVDLARLQLSSLLGSVTGSPQYSSVLLRTLTGNVYTITRSGRGGWSVHNARRNKSSDLPISLMATGEVVVGERLNLERRHTRPIVQIVAERGSIREQSDFGLKAVVRAAVRHAEGHISFLHTHRDAITQAQAIDPAIHSHTAQLDKRPVLVLSGIGVALGFEQAHFELKNIASAVPVSRKQAFEVIFRTASGSIYGIIRNRKGELLLVNSRSSQYSKLTTDRLELLSLALGERFKITTQHLTSPVKEILTIHRTQLMPGEVTLPALRDLSLKSCRGNMTLLKHELLRACRANFGEERLNQILRARE